MLSVFRWVVTRISANWDMLSWLATWVWTLAGAAVSGWVTWATGNFAAYSPFSWVAAALIGGLIFSVSAAGIGWARERHARAQYLSQVAKPPISVNPLRQTYEHEKVLLSDFWHPLEGARVYKNLVFRGCDIYGPCSVVLMGGSFQSPKFYLCDTVSVTNAPLFTAIMFDNCYFYNCRFFNVTIFVPKAVAAAMIEDLKKHGWKPPIIIGFNEEEATPV